MRRPYKTDLTDEQWAFIEPILPPARPKNGFAPTDLREVVNTILYQTATGVQWDMLPHDLVSKSTAFDYYARWSRDGTWERVLDAARRAVRVAAGRDESPSAAAIDSQSVETAAGGGEAVGTDGGKRVKGRKRHVVTDTLGLLLAVVVTAANVSDGRAAPAVLNRVALPDRCRLEVVFADGRYHDAVCEAWFAVHPRCRLEVVGRPPGERGFVPLKVRWVVERTFAWLVSQRRLVRDYERCVWSSETRFMVASISIMMRRPMWPPPRNGNNYNTIIHTHHRSPAKVA
jgi:putative transposase